MSAHVIQVQARMPDHSIRGYHVASDSWENAIDIVKHELIAQGQLPRALIAVVPKRAT